MSGGADGWLGGGMEVLHEDMWTGGLAVSGCMDERMHGWMDEGSRCPTAQAGCIPKSRAHPGLLLSPLLTETMIFAMVWLDILASPNALMLKAPIFSVVATCGRRTATSSNNTSLGAAILCSDAGGAQPS